MAGDRVREFSSPAIFLRRDLPLPALFSSGFPEGGVFSGKAFWAWSPEIVDDGFALASGIRGSRDSGPASFIFVLLI